MKILWNENPLQTVIELDDNEKHEFRLKVYLKEIEQTVYQALWRLDKEKAYYSPEKAAAHLNSLYDSDDSINFDTKPLESDYELYLSDLSGFHGGDCTCVPCSCMKCNAEYILGVSTIVGLGKHEGAKLQAFFDYTNKDNKTLDDAIAYFKDYKVPREKPDNWKKFTQKDYEIHIQRWERETQNLYQWLLKYKEDHFS